MTDRPIPAERIVDNYDLLFDPLARAAHRACLEHARLTRDDRWPTIRSCLDFAKLYGVPGAELAAFFGYLGYHDGARTVWVDALRGEIPTYAARHYASKEQLRAYGFQCAFTEVVERGASH